MVAPILLATRAGPMLGRGSSSQSLSQLGKMNNRSDVNTKYFQEKNNQMGDFKSGSNHEEYDKKGNALLEAYKVLSSEIQRGILKNELVSALFPAPEREHATEEAKAGHHHSPAPTTPKKK